MNLTIQNAILNDQSFVINTGERNQAIQLFHLLMERVFLKNKKNVAWDGKKATVFIDKTKVNRNNYNYIENFDYKLINYFDEWSAMFVDSNGLRFSKEKLISRTKTDYFLLDLNFYFRVRKVDYQVTADSLRRNINFREITSDVVNEKLLKRFKNVSIYRGVIEEEGQQYAGFRAIVDGYSEVSYELSYFSKGAMTEISKSAFSFIHGFCDSFF